MATLIHSIHDAASKATPGERRFGQRLSSHLEDDYLVWYDVPIGSNRRYPDFVLLHPQRGLLVLEVKDWKTHSLRKLEKLRWEVTFSDQPKTVANPLEQARQIALALVGQLSTDPQLCHDSGKHEGKLAFPWGYGVVLPNITRRQWDELLSEEQQELVLPGRRVICKDEMLESVDALAFQERLWGMFEYTFGSPLTLPQIERVRWHVFPEVRIDEPKQGELFEDEPVPDLIKVLDLQQEQLARNLGGGHRVIHGVAGSGKTLILGYRCVQLAETLSKPALVLCYNITLAMRLKSFIATKGLADKVRVHHFHEWCGEMLRTFHVGVEPGDAPHWERQVTSVIGGVKNGFIPRGQYGAVLIDEGHDFEPEWLKLVVQMVDPATDSFLLLYDDAQSIYRKKAGLGFALSSVGVKASGRTTILRLNYRNSREILKFAYDFAKDRMGPESADDDHIPLIEPSSAGTTGPQPVVRIEENEVDYAMRCVQRWIDKGVPMSEIAVIYVDSKSGKATWQALQQQGIPCSWLGSTTNKKSYEPNADRVTIVTAQSSKGLEFQSVVVVGVGSLDETEEQRADHTRLLYVALTRAKKQLAVTSTTANFYANRLEASTVRKGVA